MSATTSATTGRRYGLKRVCRTWERSRSALYARRARVRRPARGDGSGRRGADARPVGGAAAGGHSQRTWPAPRSRARAIARSTRGCGSSMTSGSPGRGCCA